MHGRAELRRIRGARNAAALAVVLVAAACSTDARRPPAASDPDTRASRPAPSHEPSPAEPSPAGERPGLKPPPAGLYWTDTPDAHLPFIDHAVIGASWA